MTDTEIEAQASPPTSIPWVPIWPLSPTVPAPVDGQWLKGSGGAMVWSPITVANVSGAQATAEKGVANGYASLGSDGKVPAAQLPATSALPARLGTNCQSITDWNVAVDNGWYMAAGASNAPAGAGGGWLFGMVIQHNTSWVLQQVWRFTDTYPLRWERVLSGGTWLAWRSLMIFYAGAWNAGAPYPPGTIVAYNGRYWLAADNTLGNTPA